MELNSFTYSKEAGWSVPEFPALDSARTLILVFADPEYGELCGPLHRLLDAFPESHIAGCSTAGEISGSRVSTGGISVTVARFESGAFESVVAGVQTVSDSRSAGESIGSRLNRPGLRCVLVFSNGLTINGSELTRGLNSALPSGVAIGGGLAGDGSRFKNTWVIAGRNLESRVVAAVGVYGDRITVSHGSKGGWDAFGPERRVTRSAGNVLYELDERPALTLYKQYLGELAAGLPANGLRFPLAIRTSQGSDQIVRTILGVNEADQSIVFAGDIPQGCLAQLMRANFDRLISGASDAAEMAAARQSPDESLLALAVSCVGRRLVLGERVEEETEAAIHRFPPNTHQVGFYSYGEISRLPTGPCDLHNQTMTITTLGERL